MKKLSEGRKMFLSVMVIFVIYAIIFILFEDYDRNFLMPFEETSDWHLLLFSLVVMAALGVLLHRYSLRMDERINQEHINKETQMRRELTQNISHELKTPVTSILGYTETILEHPEMDDSTQRQFIERTQSQAHRLSSLLQDISMLNRMDIIKETALAAGAKHMTVYNYLPEIIITNGNNSLIYSIFRNLMDNAINYAGEGKTIAISAFEQDDKWYFSFSDNGVGIPVEHMSRVFERFYRVDKGRSRSLGGTGLGLAIVKNAVMLHGGTIIAQAPTNGGLCFKFTLKK